MNDIIIIQNTDYHFETTISLYQLFKDFGYNPHIYRCKALVNQYKQKEFCKKYDIKIIEDTKDLNKALCYFIVSTYPNPHVTKFNAIPNYNDKIFSLINHKKIIYISHRFKNKEDYNGNINETNALSLSPISKKINIDHIILDRNPITPSHTHDDSIKITIQGHFKFKHRDVTILKNNILQTNINKKITFNFLGTNTRTIINQLPKNINITINNLENLDEENFYHYLNKKTDWLFAISEPDIKNQTYKIERYSSTFNHAIALEKPVLCHKFFEEIYQIPGIYFNKETNVIQKILEFSKTEYDNLISNFKQLKNKTFNHNKEMIEKKINELYAT